MIKNENEAASVMKLLKQLVKHFQEQIKPLFHSFILLVMASGKCQRSLKKKNTFFLKKKTFQVICKSTLVCGNKLQSDI